MTFHADSRPQLEWTDTWIDGPAAGTWAGWLSVIADGIRVFENGAQGGDNPLEQQTAQSFSTEWRAV